MRCGNGPAVRRGCGARRPLRQRAMPNRDPVVMAVPREGEAGGGAARRRRCKGRRRLQRSKRRRATVLGCETGRVTSGQGVVGEEATTAHVRHRRRQQRQERRRKEGERCQWHRRPSRGLGDSGKRRHVIHFSLLT
ncbi:unnamed protein product [Phaeothamnion confervicola]